MRTEQTEINGSKISGTSANAPKPLHTEPLHPAFEFVRSQTIPSLSIELIESRHKVTGATHFHLATDNDENAFLVAFRTQPMDSRGIAHILEHTTLCGSEKYPVRDPFFSMIRRSLNTFMNAFTSADWTAYPFASQNRTDFFNLLSVYLDATFFANLNPLDFAQEGIRVELDNGKPVFKGVVFNEMKGAMSSPNDQLYYRLAHHLYPSSTYHYNSGGDPAVIPDLTYEDLLAFYQTHYHPSNAVFMTFGNLPLAELQAQFEEQALNRFDAGRALQSTPEQRFTEPRRVVDGYTLDQENASGQTFHQLAWLLPPSTNTELRLALRLMEGILLEHSASPLRQYLETSGLGSAPAPMLGLDDSNYEMTFMAGIRGSEPEKAAELEAGVLAVLEQVASAPIDPEHIESVLHQIELNQREITGDGFPYGLQLILKSLGNAIHGGDVLRVWQLDDLLSGLRAQLKDPMWLPGLIRTHLIDNPHRVLLTLQPDATLSSKQAEAEQHRLESLAATLTEPEKQALQAQQEALAARQAQVDDISLLPKVGLEDIPADLHIAQGECIGLQTAQGERPLHRYAAGTNGLYYVKVLLSLPAHLLGNPLLPLYSQLVGELGAGERDYLEVQEAQAAQCGGISVGLSTRTSLHDSGDISAFLMVSTRAMVSHPEALGLLQQVFNQCRFDESSRILDLLMQRKARWEASLSGNGHAYAMQTASRDMSALARAEYRMAGLPALQWLREVLKEASPDSESLRAVQLGLQALHQEILSLPRQFLLVAESDQLDSLTSELGRVWQQELLPMRLPFTTTGDTSGDAVLPSIEQWAASAMDQSWLIQASVQFCAETYPAVPSGHADAPALMVLGPYLRNGFLHRALREQGGAYGGGAGYDSNACTLRFYSFRDPRLAETFEDFGKSIQWLLNEPQEAYQLEEAILGLIAGMDKPGSPAGEAISACLSSLHDRTPEVRRQLRKALLGVTLEDLQRVARRYVQPELRVRSVVAPFAKAEAVQQLGLSATSL